MAKILFPSSSSPGVNRQEGGGRLINAYAEKLGPAGPASFVIRRAPGLRLFAGSGETGIRGQTFIDPYLYAAFSNRLVRFDSVGVGTAVGTLNGSDWVTFARNNRTPTPDRVVVTEDAVYTFTDTSITELVDGDLPQPNSVCFIDGYFFYTIADGRCFASEINGTGISSNDYIRAEAKPDGLLRGVAFARDLYLCGPSTIEVWSNTGNATGFPFSRTTVIWRGLAGRKAIAGFEDGFATALLWVSDDNAVHQLSGYGTQKVSPPELDRLIEATTDKDQLEASVFVVGGHPCWRITGPNFTWVYDIGTQDWHERHSYLDTRWRVAGNSVQAFGRWLTGDRLSGSVLEITEDTAREAGEPLVWEVVSGDMGDFPSRFTVPRAQFYFVTGTGVANGEDPIERQPQVAISWSDDGAVNWSTPVLREIGPQQVTKTRVVVNRCGMTSVRGRRWRLAVADPVYVGLIGGDMQIQGRSG
ncbi:hypothetical protein [Kaistia sp. MMO-174]|uniref:hypothetical protein n=1 Tax=Kaistia sp. MMO-174 TaxID=3081256 RepID=UPI00301A4291